MPDEAAWVAAIRAVARGRPIVGVMGGGTAPPAVERLAEETGRALARVGWAVLTGGGGGVMAAASRGAHQEGALVLGVLPTDRPSPPYPNPYVSAAFFTGLGTYNPETGNVGRNRINVLASDAVVALPGGAGTNCEIRLAAEAGRPVILLGWGRADLEDATQAAGARSDAFLEEARDPQDVVNRLRRRLLHRGGP